MGQKILPISLRLHKTKHWDSLWVPSKKDYSNIFFQDFELRRYFQIIFNSKNLHLQNLQIKNINHTYFIYLFIQTKIKRKNIPFYNNYLNKTLLENNLNKIYQKNFKIYFLNLNLYFLKKKLIIKKIYYFFKLNYKYYNKLRKIIYLLNLIILTKNAYLLSILLLKMLKNKKFHKKIILNIHRDLSNLFQIYSSFLGYKIQLKGKINGRNRSKKLIIKKGQIPLNTLNKNIQYSLQHINTPSGICSIKIWLYFI